MRYIRFNRIWLIALCVATLPYVAQARIWSYQSLTQNNYNDRNPSLDGNIVVWSGKNSSGKNAIIQHDLKLNQVTVLSAGLPNYKYLGPPRVSGHKVVWRAYDLPSGMDRIFLWNGSAASEIVHYPTGTYDYTGYPPSYNSLDPTIAGDRVAYAAWDGTDYEVYLWQPATGVTQITSNSVDDYEVVASEQGISWTADNPANESKDVYYWNGAAIVNVSNQSGTDEDSHTAEGNVVFSGYPLFGSPRKTDIFLWDGIGSRVIAEQVGYDYEPELGGGFVTWTGWPYGKGGTIPSVAFAWDRYKVEKLSPSDLKTAQPRISDGKAVFLESDGNDLEVVVASYIVDSFVPDNARSKLTVVHGRGNVIYAAGTRELFALERDLEGRMFARSRLPQGLGGTRSMVSNSRYLFVAQQQGAILVYDLAVPTLPQLLGQIATLGAPQDLALSGDILYVGNKDDFRIFDVSNGPDSVLLSSINFGRAYGVAVNGNIAVIANSTGGAAIVDVTDPTSPAVTARIAGVCNKVLEVAIKGSIAYLLCADYGFRSYDISVPYAPVAVADLQLPVESDPAYYPAPLSMQFIGTHAFISGGDDGLYVIDLAQPQSPAIVERYPLGGYSADLAVSLVQSPRLYIAATDGGVHSINVSEYSGP